MVNSVNGSELPAPTVDRNTSEKESWRIVLRPDFFCQHRRLLIRDYQHRRWRFLQWRGCQSKDWTKLVFLCWNTQEQKWQDQGISGSKTDSPVSIHWALKCFCLTTRPFTQVCIEQQQQHRFPFRLERSGKSPSSTGTRNSQQSTPPLYGGPKSGSLEGFSLIGKVVSILGWPMFFAEDRSTSK